MENTALVNQLVDNFKKGDFYDDVEESEKIPSHFLRIEKVKVKR